MLLRVIAKMKKIKAKKNRSTPAPAATMGMELTAKQNLRTEITQDAEKNESQQAASASDNDKLPARGDAASLEHADAEIRRLALVCEGLISEKNKLVAESLALTQNVAERFRELAILTLMLEDASKLKQQNDAHLAALNELSNSKTVELTVVRQEIARERQNFDLELAKKDEKLRDAVAKVAEFALLNVQVEEKPKTFFRKRKAGQEAGSGDIRINKLANLLRRSGLFDSEWYLRRYPDVNSANVDPVAHYLQFGADENRDPGPLFSTAGYALENPDVVEAKMNCLVHYLCHGRKEGRQVYIPL
jgi:hypothetical protein